MRKSIKIIFIGVLFSFALLNIMLGILCIIYGGIPGMLPFDQPGSIWESTDGDVIISEVGSNSAVLTIKNNETVSEYLVRYGRDDYHGIYIYRMESDSDSNLNTHSKPNEYIDRLSLQTKNFNTFSLTSDTGMIFDSDETITLIRTSKGNVGGAIKILSAKILLSLIPFSISVLLLLIAIALIKGKTKKLLQTEMPQL